MYVVSTGNSILFENSKSNVSKWRAVILSEKVTKIFVGKRVKGFSSFSPS